MNPEDERALPPQAPDPYDLTSFDSPLVNALAPPLVCAAAVIFTRSPLGFLLEGFHVWVHEVGHASMAWLNGRPALPLPIGWTNVAPEKSFLLYAAILAGIGALAAAGWRERRLWPMMLSMILLGAQTFMTWRLPDDRARMWMIFGGVGGEFYLAASMTGLFYFEFPEKFMWGSCRYVALFIGASSFYRSYAFWSRVRKGLEGIPYGSMINGEDDGGGDMNILLGEYGWSQHRIIATYGHLADFCLVSILVVYVVFNLRLNKVLNPLLGRIMSVGLADPKE